MSDVTPPFDVSPLVKVSNNIIRLEDAVTTSDPKDKMKQRAATAELRRFVPLQLAFWPEDRRAIANELARCALFSCRDTRKPRQYFDNSPLFMLGEGAITYRGEELRTQDEDIFISLAHMAREMPGGKMLVTVSSSDICKMNGWRQDQRYYDAIFLSIQRLKAGVITVFSRRLAKAIKCQRALDAGAAESELAKLYDELQQIETEALKEPLSTENGAELAGMMLSLISGEPIFSGGKSLKNNIPQGNLTWEISLDKNLVSLFAKPYLTLVDMHARGQLSATGKRLQSYFGSHKHPYPVKLRSLEKMLGLSFGEESALKFAINQQLEELKRLKVISRFEFHRSASEREWLVTVIRSDSDESAQND